jgi:hypothetical protein
MKLFRLAFVFMAVGCFLFALLPPIDWLTLALLLLGWLSVGVAVCYYRIFPEEKKG